MKHQEEFEWRTLAVAAVIWALFGSSFWLYANVAPPAGLLVLALSVGWYGSLQHEATHGHPTAWKAANLVVAGAPLGLVYPFEIYRSTHLAHHNDLILTDPRLDPESRYMTPDDWDSASAFTRWVMTAERTLVGRLTLGVIRVPLDFWIRSVPMLAKDRIFRRSWMRHIVLVAGLLYLVSLTAMPVWAYVLISIYGCTAGTLLRSFAEHAAVTSGTKSAVVEAGPIMSLFYLNNNLHHTHHAEPTAAWYRLPALHVELNSSELARQGAGLYPGGYLELFRRFGLRPFGQPVHPLAR